MYKNIKNELYKQKKSILVSKLNWKNEFYLTWDTLPAELEYFLLLRKNYPGPCFSSDFEVSEYFGRPGHKYLVKLDSGTYPSAPKLLFEQELYESIAKMSYKSKKNRFWFQK